MALLPVELWLQIFGSGLPQGDLCALSMSSSLFHSMTEDLLYANVTLSSSTRYAGDEVVNWVNDDEDDDEYEYDYGDDPDSDKEEYDEDADEYDGYEDEEVVDDSQVGLFLESVTQRPALAALVQALHIEYKCNNREESFDHWGYHPILIELHRFPALRQLRACAFRIDEGVLRKLQSHPRLTSVEFNESLCGKLSNVFQRWSGVGIQSLMYVGYLESLVSKALSDLPLLATLRRLLIEGIIPGNISPILTSCPQLRCLDLYRATLCVSLFDSLPPGAMPLLEEFAGPFRICRNIVWGRPIHSLKLRFNGDMPFEILQDLKFSTVPITKLLIDKDIHENLMHLPASLEFFGWNSLLEKPTLYSPALSRLPKLAVIAGHTDGDALITKPNPKHVVSEYSKACPSLKEIVFQEEIWRVRKDGWERYLRLEPGHYQ